MKWLRLCLSVVLFPVSLLWYKRDIHHYKIHPVVYWLVMSVYVVINVVVAIRVVQEVLKAMPDLP